MRAAIYNPYLDTLGGGERYSMAVARVLLAKGYSVDVEWVDSDIKGKLEKRFGVRLDGVNFVSDVNRGDGYDLCFWVSDGSVPALRARNNFLHFQVPFKDVNGKSLINRAKMFRVKKVICNSEFTKKIIDKEYGVDAEVIYPPVEVDKIRPKRKKENIILYVGRFSGLMQSKGQDVLIEVFKKIEKKNKDWRLILAGGAEVGGEKYVDGLARKIGKSNVELIQSPGWKELVRLYGLAKIFWSASGYGVDEERAPEKVEHFGITVVEAMAGGCVPIVINKGGHKEIIDDGKNGLFWDKKKELAKTTQELIEDSKRMREMSRAAKHKSVDFSYDLFDKDLSRIV